MAAFDDLILAKTGLVGYWKLDEAVGAGTFVDSSGNGNDATPVGDIVAGETDAAFPIVEGTTVTSFNPSFTAATQPIATTGYLDAGDPVQMVATTRMTVGFWAKIVYTGPSSPNPHFLSKGDDAVPTNRTFRFYQDDITDDDDYTGRFFDSTGSSESENAENANFNDWHFFTFAFNNDTSEYRIYRDAVEEDNDITLNITTINDSTAPLRIGGELLNEATAGDNGMLGFMSRVFIINEYLTPAEITELYASRLIVGASATSVKSSTLIDFTGNDLLEPIQISVDPSPVNVNTAHCFLVYASTQPTLVSPVDGTVVGTLQATAAVTEFVDLSGSNSIGTDFPVATVTSVNAVSEIVQNKVIIATAGDPIPVSTILNATTINAGAVTGQVQIIYTPVNQWKFNHTAYSSPGPRTVCFTSPAQPTAVPFTYTVAGSGAVTAQRKVIIRARDFCTDVPIVGATVTLDGIVVGVTDVLGEFNAGILSTGTHSIKLSNATGFTDTDLDPLVNDSFIVTVA